MVKDKKNIGMIGSIILIIGIGISIYFTIGIEKEKVYRTMMFDNKVATFMVDNEVYTRIAIIDGKLESNLDIPEKENYTFDHWEINGKRYTENTKLNEDTTITAVFQKDNSENTPVSTETNSKIIVTGISIDKTNVNMSIGESISLKGTVSPSNATNKKISWLSSNSSIVTVDKNGKITGVGNGNAIIIARTNNGKEATCSVNVTGNTIGVTGISLDKKDVSINVGDSLILNSEITPANASNKTVTWQSSNSKIVEVTQSGKITGKSSGTATITVKTSNGKEAKCTVKVNSNTIEVESVSLSRTNVSLEVGKSITIEASVSPSNATNKNISWQSSNNSVVNVSDGKIIGVGSGTATITAVAHNGKGKECQVTVSGASAVMPTSINLNSQSLSMIVGDKTTLKATITPSNTTDKKITWTSSNTQSVTVDQNGAVSAIGVGESTITAKVGNVKAECKITVKAKTVLAESILIKPTSSTVTVGNEVTIEASISPSNTTDKTITWISSNPNIATVTNGKVKGISGGTVTITAKTSNGKTAQTQITIVASSVPTVVPIASDGTINNDYFGITKGDNANDTVATKNREGINAAINYAGNNGIKNIKLVKGKYIIKLDNDSRHYGIKIQKSNINFNLNESTISILPTNYYRYRVIYISGVKNVSVYNGTIVGDKGENTCKDGTLLSKLEECPNDGSSTSEKLHPLGYGILIEDSENIIIGSKTKGQGLTIRAMIGDGININDSTTKTNKTRNIGIYIYNNNIYHCRRQGISIISGEKIEIKNNMIHSIKGTNPQSGIDIEPDANEEHIDKIDNVIISNNTLYSIHHDAIHAGACSRHVSLGEITNVTIKNNTVKGKSNIYVCKLPGLNDNIATANTFTDGGKYTDKYIAYSD